MEEIQGARVKVDEKDNTSDLFIACMNVHGTVDNVHACSVFKFGICYAENIWTHLG